MTQFSGNILVVDDKPDNLRLLSVMLSEQGYKVRKALNGQTAIATVRQVPPDLILLDINMPGMNGYQVCQSLKADETTREIPVIFISALDDVFDKIQAFQVGGVDYISKPFQIEEVIARIENQLTIQRQKWQLQQEIQERQKTEQTLRFYLHAVSHDLRNPVLGMSLMLQYLLKKAQVAEESTTVISLSVLEQLANSCDRQLHLINTLVETQQWETGNISLQCQPLSLHALVQQLAAEWEPLFAHHQATFVNLIAVDFPLILGERDRLWRVLENLIGNALKHNDSGIQITVTAEVMALDSAENAPQMPMARCYITDNGIGMTTEQAALLFNPYQRGERAKKTLGLGLGLYLCRQLIQAHGGEIGVISHPHQGTQFWFTLPLVNDQ